MQINKFGGTLVSEQEAFDALYSDKIKDLKDLFFDQAVVEQFNQSRNINKDSFDKIQEYQVPAISLEEFDALNQKDWFMPDEYKNFEIVGFLLDQTNNEEQYQRVVSELELFYHYGMIDLLKYLKYLVDTMKSNNIVWGVGRGSSVASYCLYLIGIHRIDSIKYQLDIREFLK
jgi:DNA polymerase III alpha subunit